MEQMTTTLKNPESAEQRPVYEPPRMQQMTEHDILNSFQITLSMGGWWTNPTCC